MRSRPYIVLLVFAAIVGVIVSVAAWCFLELVYQTQQEIYVHLPHAVGYPHGEPVWWPIPVLLIAGVIVAAAISKLPGNGGHIPAFGLAAGGPPKAPEMPGILLAGIVSIGLGVVIGPEAPLIALGAGLGVIAIRRARADAPDQVVTVVAAAGSFAAVSFIFQSPMIAAVLMIEVLGIGGARLQLVIIPGLLGAGIGSLVSLGMGSFTGLSTSAFALPSLQLPAFAHPHVGNFAWTIALAIAIGAVTQLIMRGGIETYRIAKPRPFVVLPAVGLLIAGLAIAFHGATGKSIEDVLFDGQAQLPGLVAQAGTYSVGALLLLILLKGVAYGAALGSFRGGPTFPALFLGAAAGLAASRLPGFPETAAVAVGLAAATVSVLKLPLSAVVIATVLTGKSGNGAAPLIIVGTVVAFVVTLLLTELRTGSPPARVPAGT
jgi:H+/Cl- antiporter ClcA